MAESKDPSCLREENIKQTIENFEEYAAGGLEYMHENFETTQLKEEVQKYLFKGNEDNIILDLLDT